MTEAAEARHNAFVWRGEQRAALLATRLAMTRAEHRSASRAIGEHLRPILAALRPAVLAAYWPCRREFNPLPVLRGHLATGVRIALPVVRSKNEPLEFRLWRPGATMTLGAHNIPHPAEDAAVLPDALLIPMVGFDAAGYRLGYGGGYYDRTAAALSPRPPLIGIAFEFARLQSIQPLAHDIPMDCIVTELGTHIAGSHHFGLSALQGAASL